MDSTSAEQNLQQKAATSEKDVNNQILSDDGHISDNSDYFPPNKEKWSSVLKVSRLDPLDEDVMSLQQEPTLEPENGAEIECGSSGQIPKARSRPLGQLGNFTFSAIGDNKTALPCLPIVASKPRAEWLADLDNTGYGGLLFVDMSCLKEDPGFQFSWWFTNRDQVRRRLIQTPLENSASAGIFTLLKPLPSGSLISAVTVTVAELLSSGKGISYGASTVQMFVPSQGGFSKDFRADTPEAEIDHAWYRCFWYLGSDQEESPGKPSSATERESVFIGSAGSNLKVFGTDTVLNLAAYYGEADRKFCLHPGDILIMDNKYPFAIDLPLGGRAKGARILSWHAFPKTGNVSFPTIMTESEIVMNIEEIISSNTEARDFYAAEFESFEISPGSIGDPEGFMERYRVTPGKYGSQDVFNEVENNPSIMYINTEYFDDA